MKKQKFIWLTVLVMLLWGSLFPFVKLGYKEFNIDTSFIPNIILFAGLRFFISGIIICIFCRTRKISLKMSSSTAAKVLLVGLFAVILHYSCTYWGLTLADSSKTAMLKQLAVFIFIPFSFLFFKEDKFSVKKLLGAVLGFAGVLVLSINFSDMSFSFGIGELLILGASVCTVCSNIVSKKVLSVVDPIAVTGVSQAFGGSILIITGLALGGGIYTITPLAVLVFSYTCLASIFGYCLWYYSVKHADLSKLFIIKFLEPLFAGVFGMLLLGENIFRIEYLLALLLVGGAIFVSH